MSKVTTQEYFDSLVDYYERDGPNSFRIRSNNGSFTKIEGQIIFEMLYNDELDLMSDGYFKISFNRNV